MLSWINAMQLISNGKIVVGLSELQATRAMALPNPRILSVPAGPKIKARRIAWCLTLKCPTPSPIEVEILNTMLFSLFFHFFFAAGKISLWREGRVGEEQICFLGVLCSL